jgi:methionine synthase II (cobalamin-independent)
MSEAYRADHVGSFLRPAEVKEARAAFREGRLQLERLHDMENRAILAALECQRSIGVDVFTDGEFRRSGFQNDLVEAVEGFVATDRPAVFLGLVSSKVPTLESQDELRRRLDEAARYVPIENLALSPQCGFASTAAGNLLTEDEQWRKLELVVETARKVWGS